VTTRRLAQAVVPGAVSVASVVAAFALAAAVLAISGASPVRAFHALVDGALVGRSQIGGTLSITIPLVLVALAWIVAFTGGRVNIGFQGQMIAGGVVAVYVGTAFANVPTVVQLPLAVAAGVAGGAAYAAIAAVLWATRHINEIISTLMLNFIAIQLASWIVRGPLQEPTHTFPQTAPVSPHARWPALLAGTPLTSDFVLALALVFLTAFALSRTTFGFRLRATGRNADAAFSSGIRTVRVGVLALMVSGALAGLAGSSIILGGQTSAMSDDFAADYGFVGIVVALLARNSPLAVVPSAFLFAALEQGAPLLQARVGLSSVLVQVIQGLVILMVAGAAVFSQPRRFLRPLARRSHDDSIAAGGQA
jgi:ABC-type uncharacterized transport system permease subunit